MSNICDGSFCKNIQQLSAKNLHQGSILWSCLVYFSAQAQKIINILPEKFLIFQEMEFSNSKLKKFPIFSQKLAFLIFLEMEPSTFKPKKQKK